MALLAVKMMKQSESDVSKCKSEKEYQSLLLLILY